MNTETVTVETFEIPGHVMIPYPQEDLVKLKSCLRLQGFIILATKHTGLSKDTIKKYAKEKEGQKSKVDDLRAFVNVFLEKAAL